MKVGNIIFIVHFCLLLLISSSALAVVVTLAWDANTEPDLSGYKILYRIGSSGEPYDGTGITEGDSPIDVGNIVKITLQGLTRGKTYFFVVIAYDTESLESDFSNEVKYIAIAAVGGIIL